MAKLDLSNNKFTGPVDLTSLPDSIFNLLLDSNTFSGVVSLDRLPAGMNHLGLSDTNLSGAFSYGRRTSVYIHLIRSNVVERYDDESDEGEDESSA